ncbi:MAG: hypothetical protein NTW08_05595 [Gammaproteobacteria bacterium]|nr:hypothetical protein [Gammaproteobacteria bacterium]
MDTFKAMSSEEREAYVLKLRREANIPYSCKNLSQNLRKRVFKLSESLSWVGHIKHLTSNQYIDDILESGLLGRQTLEAFQKPFKPAALQAIDIQNGDENSICFGFNQIDSLCMRDNSIELTFNFQALLRDNPVLFFKQRDFGFKNMAVYTLSTTSGPLSFCFSSDPRGSNMDVYKGDYTHLNSRLLRDYYSDYSKAHFAHCKVFNPLLISNNLSQMQQILIHSFFRYLDAPDPDLFQNDEPIISQFLDDLEKMDDASLKEMLCQIGLMMSDAMEVNIYGAYCIDFSTLEAISYYEKANILKARLELGKFIQDLTAGHLSALKSACAVMPNLFKSERFLLYLKEKVGAASLPVSEALDQMIKELPAKQRATERSPQYPRTFFDTRQDDEDDSIDEKQLHNGNV